jgi:hypothetical protein
MANAGKGKGKGKGKAGRRPGQDASEPICDAIRYGQKAGLNRMNDMNNPGRISLCCTALLCFTSHHITSSRSIYLLTEQCCAVLYFQYWSHRDQNSSI